MTVPHGWQKVMGNRRCWAGAILLWLLAGCVSTSKQVEEQREAEESIARILSEPLDSAEYGETKRCLGAHEFRNFRVIDDRRILFEGSRDRLWLNTLRMRCPDLRFAEALRVRSTSAVGRICDMGKFVPTDWFDLPWHRRWPWDWNDTWATSVRCSLGSFQPVTETQVEAIEAALRDKR